MTDVTPLALESDATFFPEQTGTIDADPTSKICSICNVDKPLTEFTKLKAGKYGRNSQCKNCRKEKRKATQYDRPPDTTLVQCVRCNRTLTAESFNTDRSATTGLQTYCRDCHKKEITDIASTFNGFLSKLVANLNRIAKKKQIEVTITPEDIASLYEKQQGRCAVTNFVMTSSYKNDSVKKISVRNISIDRIDENLGYTPDNIRLVCTAVSILKSKFTEEELISFCTAILESKK